MDALITTELGLILAVHQVLLVHALM